MNATPISEDDIARLVDSFYAKIRTDEMLGPIFARAIPGDWGPHLATMRNFWSSVMLTSGRYKGNPVAVHRHVEGVELHLFDRWLALFEQTCDELFDAPVATAFCAKAHRIAESLKLTLFYGPGPGAVGPNATPPTQLDRIARSSNRHLAVAQSTTGRHPTE